MRKDVQVEERVQKHLNKAAVFFGFLVLVLIFGTGFALWSVSKNKFVAPVATQTNAVAVVVADTNKEPVEIEFSVRLRLADGETNKNNK